MAGGAAVTGQLILGVDGGGTKTDCRLAISEGSELRGLGRGLAGPSNLRALGPERALGHLEQAVAAAFADAGIDRCAVSAACLGMAGADRTSEQMQILEWAGAARLSEQLRIVNDAVPLLSVESGDGTGIALIAGTGSLAWGRNHDGRTARAGGWGYLLGDEGSAYAIGAAALRTVLMEADGRGMKTGLSEQVYAHLQTAAPAGIIERVYGAVVPRQVIAGLAPVVFGAAAQGDVAATEILQNAALELAAMTTAVATNLQLPAPFRIALTGAVLLNQPDYRQLVLTCIAARTGKSPVAVCVHEPVLGALELARQLAEKTAHDAIG
ncbi:MAG: Glucosamine kinase GspK [Planctomycetota bacterium]|jgi:N-acetylglucosamine kinase-like BadF-type ATPase